jgi:hypothetical protein
MRKRMKLRRPSHTTVVAYLSLFLVISGGAAYAAGHLGKNSVGTKQLKKNSVTTAKIKKNAVTGAKVKAHTLVGSDINLNKLGTVPTAQTANTLAPPEPIRLVGTAGQPPFLDGSSNPPPGPITIEPVGFYKDQEGIVHLEGIALVGAEENPIKGLIFQLPPGYRPASGKVVAIEQGENAYFIFGSNVTVGGKNLEGYVLSIKAPGTAVLGGISFRAQS